MALVKRRPYDSTRRRQQAAITRQEIAGAARRLFASTGYAATTMEAIAREAGVALQTVYTSFGSKRRILIDLVESLRREAGLRELHEVRDARRVDPRQRLRIAAQFHRKLFEHGADILETLRSAGQADPDIASIWSQANRRRREGSTRIARSLARSGDLRPRIGEREAAAMIYVLANHSVYHDVVNESGWSPDQYEAWLAGTLEQLLLPHSDEQTE